jgi:uncharacterized protein YegL
MRRLPVYFLLDCSESMIGPGIESLRIAVDSMISEMRRDPHALETVWLSFITFAGVAQQLIPLTPLEDIQSPVLRISPGTALGGAIKLTAKAIAVEVHKSTLTQRGDFRPLVFIITDGFATDDWTSAASSFKSVGCTVYAIGCGLDVDFHQLGKITPNVLRVQEVGIECIGKLMKWISSSVQSASRGLAEIGTDSLTENLPATVEKVNLSKEKNHDGRATQIFLLLHCQQKRGAYLARYVMDNATALYTVVATHRLDSELMDTSSDKFSLPAVDAGAFHSHAPCPYCEASTWWQCGNCKTLACVTKEISRRPVTCPVCGISGVLTAMDFKIQQRSG